MNLFRGELRKRTNIFGRIYIFSFSTWAYTTGRRHVFLSCLPITTHTAGEFMPSPICDRLFLSPVTTNEIELEIANLNASKAVGPSSIPIVILKILKCEVSGPLETIFNTSFLTGIVP